jgi:hypothetical protein
MKRERFFNSSRFVSPCWWGRIHIPRMCKQAIPTGNANDPTNGIDPEQSLIQRIVSADSLFRASEAEDFLVFGRPEEELLSVESFPGPPSLIKSALWLVSIN